MDYIIEKLKTTLANEEKYLSVEMPDPKNNFYKACQRSKELAKERIPQLKRVLFLIEGISEEGIKKLEQTALLLKSKSNETNN